MSSIIINGPMTINGGCLMVAGALSAPNLAYSFYPASGATRIPASINLSYQNGGLATSYNVYLGIGNALAYPFISGTIVNSLPASLQYATNYNWEVDPLNSFGITSGYMIPFSTVTPTWADVLVDMEAGSPGDIVTVTGFNLMSHGNTGIGTWSIYFSGSAVSSQYGSTGMFISGVESTLYTPVQVTGIVYTDAGSSRSIEISMGTIDTCIRYTLSGTTNKMSVGAWVTAGSAGGSFQTFDIIQFNNTLGGFFILQRGSNGNWHAHGDVGGSGSQIGQDMAVAQGTTYWVTMQGQQFSTCTINVYNKPNGTLFGTSQIFLQNSGYNAPWNWLEFGRCDSHGGPNPSTGNFFIFDDIILNYTSGTFPLGP